MKTSQLFTKTSKSVPADETARNAKLLIRAGYIYKDSAGVYALLPLGLKVVENIKKIVRNEMQTLGSQEILMTSLQRKELWEQTDRWSDENVDIWFKSKLKSGSDVGFAWSHEEQITSMMCEFVSSYRDLPISVYQFQNKLRNEVRAKSGILRSREFLMKDLYSYSRSEEEHQEFYDRVTKSYLKIFDAVGLGDRTFFTFASGGAFTQFSHEFQTLTEAGEDTIYIDRSKNIAINKEVIDSDEVLQTVGVKREELEELPAAEVGNIFSFGGGKSAQLGLYFTDEEGHQKPVILGSYGIGITRLMGVIAECLSDDKGLVWPVHIAPALVYLACLGNGAETKKEADQLYGRLSDQGIQVLYDDRDVSAGEKFADADLLGIPYRIVVSEKTIAEHKFELKKRVDHDTQLLDEVELTKLLVSSIAN